MSGPRNLRSINVPVQHLTEEKFRPYGRVIAKPKELTPTVSNEILSYWDDIVTLKTENPISIGFLEVRKRPFILDKLERHKETWEILAPLQGLSILPLAPSGGNDIPCEKIESFIITGDDVIMLNEGVWHWAPFPLTSTATFIVMFKEHTPKTDLKVRDLSEYGIEATLQLIK